MGDDKATSRIEQLIVNGFIKMRVSQNLDMIDEDQMLLTNSSEYKEGEAAFCCGLTARNNPYPFCSPEYWRWQEGLSGNCQPREIQVNPEPYKQEECSDGEARWAIVPVNLIPEPHSVQPMH